MKHNPGKLPGAGGLVSDFSAQMEREGLQLLSMLARTCEFARGCYQGHTAAIRSIVC